MGRMDGKVALVTGAARGTGAATARLFAAEGARVALADVLHDAGRAVAEELGDAALYVPLDVTREDDWAGGVAAVEAHFGGLDVLVNNAAVLHMAAIADTQVEDFERVLRVNQLGPFLGIRSIIEPMKRRGGGSVVNVASVDGLRGQNGIVAYASSKWGLRGITKVAALELGRFGIRVNAVCPEAGSQYMVQPYMPPGVEVEQIIPKMQPNLAPQRHRSLQDLVEDVAKAILFLASDESASCTGADFPVDGGNTAGRIVRGAPGA